MRQKKRSPSQFVKDVVSLPRKLVASPTGQGSREAQGPSVPGRVRSSPSPDVDLGSSGSDANEVSPARKECRADFPEVSTFESHGMEIGGVRWFLPRRKITILEARSIFYAVQYAERNHPPGRLLILSDNLALVPALWKRRSSFVHCFQSCVVSLALSHLVGGYRQNCIISTREVVSSTVTVTQAIPFFISLHSASHAPLRHGQATKTVLLPHRWMVVELTSDLKIMCPLECPVAFTIR